MVKQYKIILMIATITLACTPSGLCDSQFQDLTKSARLADFSVTTVYEDDQGKALGARFTHVPSGFVLDLMRAAAGDPR